MFINKVDHKPNQIRLTFSPYRLDPCKWLLSPWHSSLGRLDLGLVQLWVTNAPTGALAQNFQVGPRLDSGTDQIYISAPSTTDTTNMKDDCLTDDDHVGVFHNKRSPLVKSSKILQAFIAYQCPLSQDWGLGPTSTQSLLPSNPRLRNFNPNLHPYSRHRNPTFQWKITQVFRKENIIQPKSQNVQ